MTEPVIQVDHLRKDYGPVRAVDGISFRVARGATCCALLGGNGAGKTSTIARYGRKDLEEVFLDIARGIRGDEVAA